MAACRHHLWVPRVSYGPTEHYGILQSYPNISSKEAEGWLSMLDIIFVVSLPSLMTPSGTNAESRTPRCKADEQGP